MRDRNRFILRSDLDSLHTLTSGRVGTVARLFLRETPTAEGGRRNPGRNCTGPGSNRSIAVRVKTDGSHETSGKYFEFCLLARLAATDVPVWGGNPPAVHSRRAPRSGLAGHRGYGHTIHPWACAGSMAYWPRARRSDGENDDQRNAIAARTGERGANKPWTQHKPKDEKEDRTHHSQPTHFTAHL